MKFFEQAQLNFKRSNFFKAIELFELSLREEPLSVEQKIFSCESIQKINISLNRADNRDQLLLLGDSYLDSKNFEKAAAIFRILFDQTAEVYYLEKQFESLVEAGLVEESLKISDEYLFELKHRGLADLILKFLENNNTLLDPEILDRNRLIALVLRGDRSKVNQEVIKWRERPSKERLELAQHLIDLTLHNTKFWHGADHLLQFLWNEVIAAANSLMVTKKWLSKLVMDYWLTNGISQELIEETLQLAKKNELSVLGHELAKFLGQTSLADDFLMMMPREAMAGGEFDFANDLLNQSSEDEVSKLENNIKLLLSTKNKSEALKQAYELEKIDPKHSLVRKLLTNDDKVKSKDDQEVLSQLLSEIGKYGKKEEEGPDLEQKISTLVQFYSAQIIQESYEDMVIGFNLLELPSVSLQVLRRVDIKGLDKRDEINFYYLKAETLLKQGDFYRTRDLVEDILYSEPLLKNEKTTFRYLRGEAYYRMGNLSVALSQFKEIKVVEENYRLTEERILKIEKDK